MADANVAVNFTASINDLVAGISQARDSLASLATPAQQLESHYASLHVATDGAFSTAPLNQFSAGLTGVAALQQSLAAAHAQSTAAVQAGDSAAYADAVRASKEAITEQLRDLQSGQKEHIAVYADELKLHEITEEQKVALSRAALDQEYAARVQLLNLDGQLGNQSLSSQVVAKNKLLDTERNYYAQVNALTRQSIDAQYSEYVSLGNAITGAFNSQLRGLLSGTESWRSAFKNVLADLLIKFIEWCEKSVVQYVAAEAAKTSATTAGVATRTGAEQAGAAASMASQGASMIRSILSSAAESFAGVFGFLSPVLGPAAAGPATAAYGTVAGMAGAVASADIGMWNVPADMLTLVHHNELIMPAAEAGALRNMLTSSDGSASPGGASLQVAPTTHFHISALDSGSVSQWMKSNSSTMLKAIDEAVRHGAALGLKRLQTR